MKYKVNEKNSSVVRRKNLNKLCHLISCSIPEKYKKITSISLRISVYFRY